MRLLKKILHPDGSTEAKVSVGSAEDLWHLYNFIVPGDSVRTKTRRKVTKENSMGSMGSEMKVLALTIEVRQVDFSPDELRIQGVNTGENEFVKLGAHHTLTVHAFPPQDVTVVKKEWNMIAEERLREACNQEAAADTAAIIMSFGEAKVLLVTPSFIHTKAKITVTIAKKHKIDGSARDKSIHKFFKQVLDALLTHVDLKKTKLLLICSPGHVREEFNQYIREACQNAEQGPLHVLAENLPKVVLVRINSDTVGGLREALGDPAVAMRMENTRCSSDMKAWEDFQSMMNHDPDRCVYTAQLVLHAALMGSIATLMVSDVVFRSANPVERRFFVALIQFVKNTGGSSNIFSSNHVTGEQLALLGNVAALLKFPCPEAEDIALSDNFIDSEEVAAFLRENAPTKVTV